MQLLRKLLFPFSLIYALVVYLRNFLFDISVLSSQKFDVPIVCIGNLSVGGTGKTPMTEFLIELLKPHYKIAVLSRGYKRKSSRIFNG
ncbi:tetraacyldisaccharide 4'-kinase [Maribacter litopenaei]|uniref:tetraacyldisaccharide 4'-kinase n=1 Tax=Maribacter litopenaei TaxID=2976127 RepID=UPI0030840DCE